MYKEDLTKQLSGGCSNPACDCTDEEMFLSPACHLGAPVEVAYSSKEGLLKVACYECHKPVAAIHVAGRQEQQAA